MIESVEVDGNTYPVRYFNGERNNEDIAVFEYEDSGLWYNLKVNYPVDVESLIPDLKAIMGLDVDDELHRMLTENFKYQIRKDKKEKI
jgi:hypothetical protein